MYDVVISEPTFIQGGLEKLHFSIHYIFGTVHDKMKQISPVFVEFLGILGRSFYVAVQLHKNRNLIFKLLQLFGGHTVLSMTQNRVLHTYCKQFIGIVCILAVYKAESM